ncbi:ankyrin repeat domain-containing protein [Sulfurovum sp.]|uniref:ankyrin repeat domain-containing protein n=1 Tax=Sulfurovum sp. TaxID=1969726 RepID=UPI002867EE93|nr:ankyrin repeat domain-containing protein [Sulfurovum sp.]
MTAYMPRQQTKEAIAETTLVRDFMQTVQYNYVLNPKFMNTIDVHQKDQFGYTALYWAIYHHNMHNAKILFYYGCTLDVTNDLKKAPFCAVDSNNLDFVLYLVDKGIDIFMEYRGESLMAYAQRLGSKEMKASLKMMHLSRING